jgi:transketolase
MREADGELQAIVVGTGSEVEIAVAAADTLAADGIPTRVVSFPSWELFEAQDQAYRDSVFPEGIPSVSVEAGIGQGWERWVDGVVSVERFGASAPASVVMEKLGITPDNVVTKVKEMVK